MSYESDDKMVSHPNHYNSGKFEVIDIIEEFTKDLKGIEAVDTGNAIKYVLRWHKKNGVQDLKKAIWYLTHLVEHLEASESHPSAVVIHKMANGNYAIENDPKNCEDPEEPSPVCEHCCKECFRYVHKSGESGGYCSLLDDQSVPYSSRSGNERSCKYFLDISEDLPVVEAPVKEYDGPDEHCRTCTHRFETPENDKVCESCMGREKYVPDLRKLAKEQDYVPDTNTSDMDKEEFDLCVKSHRTAAGVYVPDEKPYEEKRVIKKKKEKNNE